MSRPRRGLARVARFAWAATVSLILIAPLSGAAIAATEAVGAVDTATPAPTDSDGNPLPADALQVTITTLTPLVPTPDGEIVMTGTVTNTTDRPIDAVWVRLRISPTPLVNRDEIATVLSGNTSRVGLYVDGTRSDVTERLAAGETSTWTVRSLISETSLVNGTSGVYVTAVEAVGQQPGDDPDVASVPVRLGLARTFLPWFPRPEAVTPSRLIWLWPMTSRPSRDAQNVFLDGSFVSSTTPTGRLGEQLGAIRPNTTVVLDPESLEAADAATASYRIASGAGSTPGSGASAATAWASKLRASKAGDWWSLPYANVDADALTRAGLTGDVVASVTESAARTAALLRPAHGVIGWAAGGDVDQATLDAWWTAGVRTTVLSDRAMPPATTLNYTPSGLSSIVTSGGTMTAVLLDSGLSDSLAALQGTQAQITAARQRFLAESAMVTADLPDSPRTVVVGPSAPVWSADPVALQELLNAIEVAPWMTPITLTAALKSPPTPVLRDQVSLDAGPTITPAVVQAVATNRAALTSLAGVVSDPTGLVEPYNAAILRNGSAAYRRASPPALTLSNRIGTALNTQIESVRIVSSGRVTFPGEEGVLPVTIANDLDRVVRVGLSVTGIPAVRLSAESIEPVVIEPGEKRSVQVRTRVLGSGPVTAKLQLLSPQGQPYGAPSTREVGTAAYARAARGVVVGAVVVLGALVAFSIRRRITGRGPKAATAAAGTDTSGGDEGTLDPSSDETNEPPTHEPLDPESDAEPHDAPGDEGDTARRGDADPPAPPA